MNCIEVLSLFSRYLEKDLDELIRKRIDRHLNECTSCERELAILSKSIRIINAAVKVKAPRDYMPG